MSSFSLAPPRATKRAGSHSPKAVTAITKSLREVETSNPTTSTCAVSQQALMPSNSSCTAFRSKRLEIQMLTDSCVGTAFMPNRSEMATVTTL